jgi:hypothetical protein
MGKTHSFAEEPVTARIRRRTNGGSSVALSPAR